jgi:serine/threonine-protein kinase
MAADPNIGLDIIGQFRIVERIGKGGMGAVYKAEQPSMSRFVAVKILHRSLASRPDLVSRFRREARAMSRLTHPNTARVFLYGQLEGGALYIVMEHLEGLNLHQTTKRNGPMGLERAARILIQVCGALDEAHAAGIIHRDLKPENIILTKQGGMEDFPKVLDFGLAKMADLDLRSTGPLTQQGMVFGTPEFMSPEQAQGKTLDGRSDIYSLGVILYELITGKLPFDAHNPTEFIRHHIKTPPIPVTQRRPEFSFPRGIDGLFERVLAKDLGDRFQTAAELAAALRPFAPDGSASPRASLPEPVHAAEAPARPQPQPQPLAAAPQESPPAAPSEPADRSLTALWVVIGVLSLVVVGLASVLGALLLSRGG